ncbi:hypothetical protein Taro_053582 [Colocasia esculenta]|uniref:Uncharacterized protein n=1 Tax=Colocasia esculenta TaxID=4460 RepID=A0A843XN25_COLES|nr:hypothetical protein [Colocasia esculenta]
MGSWQCGPQLWCWLVSTVAGPFVRGCEAERSVLSILDTLTLVFELYVRLRERRQWDSDL